MSHNPKETVAVPTQPQENEQSVAEPDFPGNSTAQELWNRMLVAKQLILEFAEGEHDEATKRFVEDLKLGLNGDILQDADDGRLVRFAPGQGQLLTRFIEMQEAQFLAEFDQEASQ